MKEITTVRIAALGPLEVTVDGVSRPLPGGRLRALLTRLAVADGRSVPTTELVEAVWGDNPPGNAANALQSLISRLRRMVGEPGLVVGDAGGYRLSIPAEAIDLHVFSGLVDAAKRHQRAGELSAAHRCALDALSYWRANPLPDAGDAEYARSAIAGLESRRLDAIGIKIEIELQRGDPGGVISDLERLVAQHPLRETFVQQLMRALAAAGRTGEALAAYERCRDHLAEQLGADPGPQLQQLHLRLLRGEFDTSADPQRDPAATARTGASGTAGAAAERSVSGWPADPDRADVDPPARSSAGAAGSGNVTSAPRDNLRRGLTSFVGREAELDRLATSITGSRLTTLIGPGGAGKTRTATEAALRWLGDGGTAAWMIELAPIRNAANIPGAILAVLGDRDSTVSERTDRVRVDEMRQVLDQLADADCLLIFDNCEHLVDGATKIISEILTSAPAVRVLATSREPLSVAGETLCELPPLPVPPPDCDHDRVTDYAAVRLWLDRAHAIKSDFTLTRHNLGPVVQIIRRLDGLPLAIELAVARLHSLPVAEIERLLSDRFRLLTAGHRGSLPRHQTLAAVVGWSWDLLSDAERLLAERLSVFPGGAGMDAASAVCADNRLSSTDIPPLLISLADKSLLQSSTDSPVRFTMLETIREYGQQRLAERDELDTARTAHADHFYDLALWLEPAVRDHRQNDARSVWDRERGNILAGLGWLIDSGRGHDALLMLLSQLWGYLVRDQESELSYLLDRVIGLNTGTGEPLLPYAQAARMVADLDGASGWEQIADQMRRVQQTLRSAPEPPFPSLALMRRIPDLALRMYLDGSAGSSELTDAIVDIAGEPEDPWVRGMCYSMAAVLCENNGQLDLMIECTERAHTDLSRTGDQWNMSRLLSQRARSLQLTGNTTGAIEALNESLELSDAPPDGGSQVLHLRLSELHLRNGDLQAAHEQLELAYSHPHDAERGRELSLIVDAGSANLAACEGHVDRALEQAELLRSRLADEDLTSMLTAHAAAVVFSAIAIIELTAGRDTADPRARARHHRTAYADLVQGYPPAKLTLDLPIVAQFAAAVAHLAEFQRQDTEAAYLLGVGARLLGADDLSDIRRHELTDWLRARLGDEPFCEQYRAGQTLDRDTAISACDPARLEPGDQTRLR